MRILSLTAASLFAFGAAGAAQAGGYTAPAVEVAPVAPVVVTAPVGDWQGGYAGGTLGYAFNGDDKIGLSSPEGASLGTAELSGANAGLRVGYRWQRDRWVFGPELSIDGGDIKDEFDYGEFGTFESKVNWVAALKLKAGYEVQPGTLLFGTLGVNKGDFTYNNSGTDIDYDATGYVVGIGAERMINDRVSLTGEYEYNNFGDTDVDLATDVRTVATPDFHNVKLGVNFKF